MSTQSNNPPENTQEGEIAVEYIPSQDLVENLQDMLLDQYPLHLQQPRRVAMKAQFPICGMNGKAGDVGMLWSGLRGEGFEEYREANGMLSALIGERYTYRVAAGRGIMEIDIPLCDDLHDLAWRLHEAVQRLIPAAQKWNKEVIGYGGQPLQALTPDCLTHKFKYFSLLRKLKEPYLYHGLQALSSIQIEVDKNELLDQLNWGHVLTPIFKMASACSPVFAGEDAHVGSGRWRQEAQLAVDEVGDGRWQMSEEPYSGMDEWVFHMLYQPHLLLRDAEGWLNPADGVFGEYAEGKMGIEIWDDFLDHMDTMWMSTTPNIREGLLQFTQIEQCGIPMQMALTALALGLMNSQDAAWRWLEDLVPDPPPKREFGLYPEDILRRDLNYRKDVYGAMQKYWHQVSKLGRPFPEPFFGCFDGLLSFATQSLKERGRGEEVYLEPLRQFWESKQDRNIELRREWILNGMESMMAMLRIPLMEDASE